MQSTCYKQKHVLVIGLGVSGRSAAHFLIVHGAFVQGVDRDFCLLQTHPDILALQQAGMLIQSDQANLNIEDFDFIVLSPGIPFTHSLVQAAKVAGIEVIGEIELGCRFMRQAAIGITGTNGKTTVTLLVAHILNHNGYPSKALGNVGVPFTRELIELDAREIVVLELSSYQLETLQQPILEQAVILNISPDHLDRYSGMDEYAAAKFKMERCLKANGQLFVEQKALEDYGYLLKHARPYCYGYTTNCTIYTDLQSVFRLGRLVFDLPLPLRGKRSHDVENLLAAYAICAERGLSGEQFLQAFATFKKPAHRIEFILEKAGVCYYDDSKGTNVDAVIRAVQSLNGSIILIAGGVDKGATYFPWIESFQSKVKYIYAIGQAAGKMQAELSSRIPVKIVNNLDQAVQQAAALAQEGEIVLLSPGCSSYDMFKNYIERGQAFQSLVRQL